MSYEDRQQVLHKLHDDVWEETLIGDLFSEVYNKILTRRERIITDEMVKHTSMTVIAKLLQVKPKTIERHIYSIKKKYRNGMKTRVDNYYEVEHMNTYRDKIKKELHAVQKGKNPKKSFDVINEILDRIFSLGHILARKFYKGY